MFYKDRRCWLLAAWILLCCIYLVYKRYPLLKWETIDDRKTKAELKDERLVSLNPDFINDFIESPIDGDVSKGLMGKAEESHVSRCPVFTFSKNITKLNEDHIRLWTISWYRHGFQPYVLTEKDALSRPEYGHLVSKVPSLEFHAGYMRWLALSSVQEGLYADLDVLPLLGRDQLFQDYKMDGCKISSNLTITEEFKFKLFLAGASSVKNVVKRLCAEKFLKGPDEIWLNLHAKEYNIKKTAEKFNALDASLGSSNCQRHMRMLKISSPIEMKRSLIRANFLNNYRINVLHTGNSTSRYAVEASLERLLECPNFTVKHDTDRLLPNLPFKCEINQIEKLESIDLSTTSSIKNLYIILAENPSFAKQSDMFDRLFPGTPRDQLERAVRMLTNMIGSMNVIFVPVDIEYSKLVIYLEFRMGMLLDKLPDFGGKEKMEGLPEVSSPEKQVYDLILKNFEEELLQFTEFDQQYT